MKRKMLHDSHPYSAEASEDVLTAERRMVLDRIGSAKRILEIGASAGHFTRLLRARGCSVTAVELDPRAATALDANEVIVGDVEDPAVFSQIRGEFDVVLMMHVLEHLVDPWSVLSKTKDVIAPGGRAIVLLPNVAAWRVRKDLFVNGRFTYEDVGILDRTHLRFFTLESARDLVSSAGFAEIDWALSDTCVPLERRLSRVPGLAPFSRRWHRWLVERNPNLCGEILLFHIRPQEA